MKNIILSISVFFLTVLPFQLKAQFGGESGEQYRIVAVKNGADSLISASNYVSLFKQFKIDLPTAFTPNGDGLNDTFGGVASSVNNYKLVIYNRHGEVIFETNSVEEKWDGTFNGTKVQEGSYIYSVSAKGPENSSINKTGKVLVII